FVPSRSALQTLYFASTLSPFWIEVSAAASPPLVTCVFGSVVTPSSVVVLLSNRSLAQWLPPLTVSSSESVFASPLAVPLTTTATAGLQPGPVSGCFASVDAGAAAVTVDVSVVASCGFPLPGGGPFPLPGVANATAAPSPASNRPATMSTFTFMFCLRFEDHLGKHDHSTR